MLFGAGYNNASNWRMVCSAEKSPVRLETLFAVMRAQGFVVYHAAQSFENLHVGVAGDDAVAVVGEELLRRTRAVATIGTPNVIASQITSEAASDFDVLTKTSDAFKKG